MTNQEWTELIEKDFGVSNTCAREMLSAMYHAKDKDSSLSGVEWAKSESADDAIIERALEELNRDDGDNISLSGIIASEILSDTESEEYRLVDTYRKLDENGKSIVDDTLVSLCGWTMNTLLEKYLSERPSKVETNGRTVRQAEIAEYERIVKAGHDLILTEQVPACALRKPISETIER